MHLPENLVPYYDDDAKKAHEAMAAKSLDQHLKEMPATKTMELAGQTIAYAELKPAGDHDSESALVLELPYANGWAPHMYLRARYLQEVAAPDKRVIVFPMNTRSDKAYDFNAEQMEKLKQGDLTPIIERQARLLKELKIGTTSLIGYSLGGMTEAMLATVLADQAVVLANGSFEAPNVMDRSVKELEKDFKSGGFDFLKAAKDAEVPALTQALGKNLLHPRAIMGMLKFGLSTFLEDNKAISRAMADESLGYQLGSALKHNPNMTVLLANAGNSKVAPTSAMAEQAAKAGHPDRVAHITVEDYGHGMGDNIVVHGLLGKAAVVQNQAYNASNKNGQL